MNTSRSTATTFTDVFTMFLFIIRYSKHKQFSEGGPEKVEGGNKVILAGLISSPPHTTQYIGSPLKQHFRSMIIIYLEVCAKSASAFLLLHACLTFSLITVSLDGLACRFLFTWKLYSNFPTMKIGPTSCYCWKHSDTWNPQFLVRLIGMIT